MKKSRDKGEVMSELLLVHTVHRSGRAWMNVDHIMKECKIK